jgi:hypothetical protein
MPPDDEKTVFFTLLPHVKALETIPQGPFEDLRVKPFARGRVSLRGDLDATEVEKNLLSGVAVNVAQVPVVYHVPPEMRHPFCEPLTCTFK